MYNIRFTKKQLEKLADQIRLLSWAQGAIFTKGLDLDVNLYTVGVIIFLWIILQGGAFFMDGRSKE